MGKNIYCLEINFWPENTEKLHKSIIKEASISLIKFT
jgi:hypothetical protein